MKLNLTRERKNKRRITMKVCVMITCAFIVSASLLVLMKIRKVELDKEEKQRTFLDIKLRVTLDVWSEYLRQIEETSKKIDELEAQEKLQIHEFNSINGKTGSVKSLFLECSGHQKTSEDELAIANTELTYRTDEFKKEVSEWEKEKEDLKQQLAKQSLVCDFLKPNSEAVRNFCGDKVMGPPKVEAPKVEAPKVEAPKVEAPKVEAPKVEAAKVEAPKPPQQQPKQDAPKQK